MFCKSLKIAAWPRQLLIATVKIYRLLFSSWLGGMCRFEPSCSSYSLRALEQHGAICGSYLTLCRLVRCQPWCAGGHDPVPQGLLFTSLIGRFGKRPSVSEKTS